MAVHDSPTEPEESLDDSASKMEAPKQMPLMRPSGWNIRDIAEVDQSRLLSGRVYRSSQVFRYISIASGSSSCVAQWAMCRR